MIAEAPVIMYIYQEGRIERNKHLSVCPPFKKSLSEIFTQLLM